jgi:hypothetical protein
LLTLVPHQQTRPTQLGRRSAQSDSQRPGRRAAEFAQNQPQAAAEPAPLPCKALRARSTSVSALPRWDELQNCQGAEAATLVRLSQLVEAVAQTIQILTDLMSVGDGVQLRP